MTRALLLLAGLGLASLTTGVAPSRAQTAASGASQTVDIVAERFSFTPSEVKTRTGTTLTIRLTSDDTAHGFRIIGTNLNVEIPKRSRGTTAITFTPEKAGRYTFECSQLCGAGHSFMRGEIVVEDPKGDER